MLAAVVAICIFAAPQASAGYYGFCQHRGFGSYETCHAVPLRHIIWSRVIREGSFQGCVSALNGNNVQVDSYVCTTTGLRATNYYDGSRWLKGRIKNNSRYYNVLSGNERYQ